ncbi:hypothetical protein [Marinigracilibium pacificum]|uniref:TnsE C-terminal domain-containing protein n=1 Tax=Marinigracilibium pacificum TaxID=2729599 RepID=A0A848J179_9BACT|nr:hypothetical protein [Marinigracilibium pacificum]NMM50317.1 hypothetical protein [Marinigracilibium pacificum]
MNDIQLRFPNSEGKWWFLSWIGKTVYKERAYLNEFYFTNSFKNSDKISDFNLGHQIKLLLPVNFLHFLTIGTIFNDNGELVTVPAQYENPYKLRIYVPNRYKATSKPLELDENTKYPFPDNTEGFKYYKFYGEHPVFNEYTAILPIHTICKYYFFLDSQFPQYIIENRISDIIESTPPLTENEEKVGEVLYDNSIIQKHTIKTFAPYFFSKDDLGKQALSMIGSNLRKTLINTGNLNTYLNSFLPYNECLLNVRGKFIKQSNRKLFLVYDIISDENVAKSILVDRINILPKYKSQTKRKPKANSGEKKQGNKKDPEKIIKITSEPTNSNSLINSKKVKLQQPLPEHEIPVEFIKNLAEENNISTKKIPLEIDIDNFSLDINKDSNNNSQQLIIENDKNISSYNRYEYLKLLNDNLNQIKEYQAEFVKIKEIDQPTPDRIIIDNVEYSFYTIHIVFKDKNFYLIEFQKGFTGILHNINFFPIDSLNIYNITRSIAQDRINWVNIYDKKDPYLYKHQVKFVQSIKHQTMGHSTIDEIVNHTIKKIDKKLNRVLKT